MLTDFLHALIEWIQQNPHWAYVGVFLTAAFESLAIVGLFLPGTVIMFGVGALIAAGALDLVPTLIWAAVGAIAGDGFSFWLGRHYHQQLRVIWPFKRYPQLMNRGVDFFHKHGGKSVVMARFIGPVRPILPAVAGMLDMPVQRFFVVNTLSALLWAPAYILPGVVFGASLGLAAEVAGRLAVLLLILISLIWFGLWLVRRVVLFLQPRAGYLLARVEHWSQNRRWAERLTASVLDPDHPEARGLTVLFMMLALASLLTTWLLTGWLGGLDRFLFEELQSLRNPFADQMMVLVTLLGDSSFLFGILAVGCVWLMIRGRYKAAVHWLAAAAATAALGRLLKLVVASPRPMPLYDGISGYSFPSGHASLSLAVYGFLAVLIARELSVARRWLPYMAASLLVIPIAFSRLYLGAHWLSDVLGGLTLGLACLALVGIAYRRHPADALGWRGLTLVTVAALAIGIGWRAGTVLDAETARYTEERPQESLNAGDWWERSWQRLPAQRHDFQDTDRQPLNIQFAGSLDTLSAALSSAGWQASTALSIRSAMQWIAPEPGIQALPVLPQVHDGLHERLRLVHYSADGSQLYVLRLWPSRWHLDAPITPLWVGNVSELNLQQRLHLFNYLVTDPPSDAPLALLDQGIGTDFEKIQRARDGTEIRVLLVRERSGQSFPTRE